MMTVKRTAPPTQTGRRFDASVGRETPQPTQLQLPIEDFRLQFREPPPQRRYCRQPLRDHVLDRR